MADIELTKEQKSAIASLKRLAKRWPKGLWLYSANGELCVMKCGKNGERVLGEGWKGESFNQDYSIDTINIPNDGGDW